MTTDENYGAGVRAWTDVVRRTRLGRTTKLVALLMANYADGDGTRIFPGVARIAVEAELTYNVVKTALAALREAGLIELVRQATRKGDSDEYRLILDPDLIERVSVLSPGEVSVAIASMRDARRGGVRKRDQGPDPQPTERAAHGGSDDSAQPSEWAAHANGAAHGDAHKRVRAAHGVNGRGPRRYPPPTTTETPTPPTTPKADLRTDSCGPRASGTSPPKTNLILFRRAA